MGLFTATPLDASAEISSIAGCWEQSVKLYRHHGTDPAQRAK